ncbi:MAG: transporter substrate-binding domain-containing protein, partial [Treponema sp.]|nr:transporter substrate-binding domain-containing protein [Treponema sp.]
MINLKEMPALALVILLAFAFSGCEKSLNASNNGLLMADISYRDIPGVTKDEITAIEALKEQGKTFNYGMLLSTETFINLNGQISGYSAFLCDWLSNIFGIPFNVNIYTWSELLDGLQNGKIDFTGDLTASDERRQTFFMTDAIAQRMIKYFRLADSEPISQIIKEAGQNVRHIPRYALLEGAKTAINVTRYALEDFEPVYIRNAVDAYELLKTGQIDAYIE